MNLEKSLALETAVLSVLVGRPLTDSMHELSKEEIVAALDIKPRQARKLIREVRRLARDVRRPGHSEDFRWECEPGSVAEAVSPLVEAVLVASRGNQVGNRALNATAFYSRLRLLGSHAESEKLKLPADVTWHELWLGSDYFIDDEDEVQLLELVGYCPELWSNPFVHKKLTRARVLPLGRPRLPWRREDVRYRLELLRKKAQIDLRQEPRLAERIGVVVGDQNILDDVLLWDRANLVEARDRWIEDEARYYAVAQGNHRDLRTVYFRRAVQALDGRHLNANVALRGAIEATVLLEVSRMVGGDQIIDQLLHAVVDTGGNFTFETGGVSEGILNIINKYAQSI